MKRLEFKAALSIDEATGAITALAWPFGSADMMGDIIEKGAFAGMKGPLPMLASHDQRDSIGVWDEIIETDKGLEVRGRLLVDDVQRAREVRALILAGGMTGVSIGFVTVKARARSGGGRTISKLELFEISVVAVPAHPGARIQSLKEASVADETLTTEQRVETLETDVTTIKTDVASIKDQIGNVEKAADRIETKMNRPGFGKADDHKEPTSEQKAFDVLVRKGKDALTELDRKALTVTTDSAGGYLAPAAFETEILRDLVEISPIRAAARVTSTTSASLIIPKRTGRLTASWVGEIEERPGTEPTYGQLEIPVHEIACWVDVSKQLLEDAAVNVEAELRKDFAEEFGRKEGEAFINGDGVKKPVGVMNDPSVPEVLNGHATIVQPDALIRLMYSLPAYYRNRGAWLLNGASIATARLFKDTGGRYLWQESLAEGQPATLLGRPVIEATEMQDVAANAFPIAYGDFNSGYRIIDRIGLSVLPDPYTQATRGITRFHARRRVGAAVVRPDALRKLKMATA